MFSFVNDTVSGDEDSVVTVCVAVTPVETSTSVEIITMDSPKAGSFIGLFYVYSWVQVHILITHARIAGYIV